MGVYKKAQDGYTLTYPLIKRGAGNYRKLQRSSCLRTQVIALTETLNRVEIQYLISDLFLTHQNTHHFKLQI
jgi:hypothetical protein